MDESRVNSHALREFLAGGLAVVGDVHQERADIQFDVVESRASFFFDHGDLVGHRLRRHVGDHLGAYEAGG